MSDPNGQSAGTLYVPGFIRNLNVAPQQSKSRLLMTVDSDLNYSEPGQFFSGDDVQTSDPQDTTTRVPDSPDGFIENVRRFGAFKGFNDGKWLGDDADKARQLEDPTNANMQAIMAGQGRKRDSGIIAGIIGAPQLQDKNGNYTTGQTLAQVNNVIAANDATAHENETIAAVGRNGGYGLTVGKLVLAKTRLDNSEIDEPEPGSAASNYFFACTSNQIQDLLLSIPVTSRFYDEAQALHNGTISYFMGFNFVRLPTNKVFNPLPKYQGGGAGNASTRKCFAYHKRAVMYRGRTIKTARVVERSDKSFRLYAYYEAEHGCFRRYDDGVWQVDCAENGTAFL